MHFDLIFKGGQVIDGSGREPVQADVGIAKDRIAAVEPDLPVEAADNVIYAYGKYITPGFIDSHSHADMTIYREDHDAILAPLVEQGITTFIGGNCGMGLGPLNTSMSAATQLYLETFTARTFDDLPWRSMGDYFTHLETQGMLLNAAILAPHSILRLETMGMERRPAESREIGAMSAMLQEAMEAGAIGLSSGLQYFPGMFSETEEIASLAKVLKPFKGTYASHLRSYTNSLPNALEEAITIAETGGIKAQISHIMFVPEFGKASPVVKGVMRMLSEYSTRYGALPLPFAKALDDVLETTIWNKGLTNDDISLDSMPTTAGFTHAFAFFPPWVIDGNVSDIMHRLQDKGTRKEIWKAIQRGKNQWPHRADHTWNLNYFKLLGVEGFSVMSVVSEKNKSLEGMNLKDLGRTRGMHPFDALCDLLIEENGHVLLFGSMTKIDDPHMMKSVEGALLDPRISISTDTILLGFGKPSELFYGCYPKYLQKFVREDHLITWGSAIRKMSGLAADIFDLPGRGYLKPGYFADIVVLDPYTVGTEGSINNPAVRPSGIDHVFVNGVEISRNSNRIPDALPGRVVRNMHA